MEPQADMLPLGAVARHQPHAAGIDLSTVNGTARFTVLAEDLIRVRIQRKGPTEPDFSYTVAKTDWPEAAFEVTETADSVGISTGSLTARMRRTDGAITVSATSGKVLFDDARVSWIGDGGKLAWKLPANRDIYGCGERAGPLQRRGSSMRMWNSDKYAFSAGTDPLYHCIPFYLGMDGGQAHGVLVDNTWEQRWDFGGPDSDAACIDVDGGSLDLYVFGGPKPADVLSRYTELTGRIPLPPLWVVGFQQSRYAYYPDSLVREIADGFRSRRIPCDVIYLDVLYMDRYKNFTWDQARFPDPAGMMADLKRQGFRTVVILDPGIKIEEGYEPYHQLLKAGLFARNPDGSPFVGREWPGECLFPDFTEPECRDWWGRMCRVLVQDGVAGIWNDMNEPEVMEVEGHTMPPDVLLAGEGVVPGNHSRFHNVYGMQMGRASYEGLRSIQPRHRAFVLARAGFAGAQRYAATWTGDNVSSWEHLRMGIPMTLNLGLSGQAICGPDVGGFSGEASPEMFGRWLQANALFPFCRAHSAKSDADTPLAEGLVPQEPWEFGPDWEAVNRKYIELRYRLLPYLYTVFEEASRTGAPIVRPMFFDYPDDPMCRVSDDQYLVGRHILCAPVVQEGADSRTLYLPHGEWYDFWTNEKLPGGREITVDAPWDHLPMYIRAGAAIPFQPVVQHTGECDAVPILWRAYLGRDGAEGDLYEDDGLTTDYLDGHSLRTKLIVTADGRDISWAADGAYTSPRPPSKVEVFGATEH